MNAPSTVLLLLALLVEGVAVGCDNPQRAMSDGALRNATANGAQVELRRLGYRTAGRLSCHTPRSNTLNIVRVDCVGRTADQEPVQVEGVAYDAGTTHPRQQFVITVSGRVVLRKSCLGQSCNARTP